MNCPYCKSDAAVKNGHAPSKKQRWKCNNCKRTFAEDSGKGFPPTTIPFEFIYWVLTQKEKNTKKLIKKTNSLLLSCNPEKTRVSRSTIYSWTKKYGGIYKKLVTPQDFSTFIAKRIKQLSIIPETRFKSGETEERLLFHKKKLLWVEAVQQLFDLFGEEEVRRLSHDNKEIFNVFVKELLSYPRKHKLKAPVPVSDVIPKRKK